MSLDERDLTLEEPDRYILAAVDYLLQQDLGVRAAVLQSNGVVDYVASRLKRIDFEVSANEVRRRVHNLNTTRPGGYWDVCKQGSSVLFLSSEDRDDIEHKAVDLKVILDNYDQYAPRRVLRGNRGENIPNDSVKGDTRRKRKRLSQAQRRAAKAKAVRPEQCDDISGRANSQCLVKMPLNSSDDTGKLQVQKEVDDHNVIQVNELCRALASSRYQNAAIRTQLHKSTLRIGDLENQIGHLQKELEQYQQAQPCVELSKVMTLLAGAQQSYAVVGAENRNLKKALCFFNVERHVDEDVYSRSVEDCASSLQQAICTVSGGSDSELTVVHVETLLKRFTTDLTTQVFGDLHDLPTKTIHLAFQNTEIVLESVLLSLLSAMICCSVLYASWATFSDGPNEILEIYRREIEHIDGPQAMRALDFIAHKKWVLTDPGLQDSLRRQTESLADTYCGAQGCLLVDHDRRSEIGTTVAESVYRAFEAAFALKRQILLSPRWFHVSLFPPETPFDPDHMRCEAPEGSCLHPSNLADPVVKLCTVPALATCNCRKMHFDYSGVSSKDHEHAEGCQTRANVWKALVYCGQARSRVVVPRIEEQLG